MAGVQLHRSAGAHDALRAVETGLPPAPDTPTKQCTRPALLKCGDDSATRRLDGVGGGTIVTGRGYAAMADTRALERISITGCFAYAMFCLERLLQHWGLSGGQQGTFLRTAVRS